MKKYEIKSPVVVVEDERKRIRIMVKIGAIEFPFTSSEINSVSNEKYFNFACNDPLLSGACKVLGIEEETIVDKVREKALALFNKTIEGLKEEQAKQRLEVWKNLPYWNFIKKFKEKIPAGCKVNYQTLEKGIEVIKQGHSPDGPFPRIYIKTPYSDRSIVIEERQAYSKGWHSRPSYVYYEITCGYNEKFGRPRKLENVLKKVLGAIETLKKRKEYKEDQEKEQNKVKKSILNSLGDSFIAKEERKYSKFRNGSSWIETKYISDNLVVRQKSGKDKYNAQIKKVLTADQVKKLDEFLKKLVNSK